jgi:hypothetical protein
LSLLRSFGEERKKENGPIRSYSKSVDSKHIELQARLWRHAKISKLKIFIDMH